MKARITAEEALSELTAQYRYEREQIKGTEAAVARMQGKLKGLAIAIFILSGQYPEDTDEYRGKGER